jgi:hypothetical protein
MPIFTQYLVARSWEKMERRIRHWSSQGFLSDLVKVDENALRAAVEPATSLSRNDTTLSSKLLRTHHEKLPKRWRAPNDHLIINCMSGYAIVPVARTRGTTGG